MYLLFFAISPRSLDFKPFLFSAKRPFVVIVVVVSLVTQTICLLFGEYAISCIHAHLIVHFN